MTNSFIQNLKNKLLGKKIFIYGAGNYGRTLYNFLQEQKICSIEGFIISKLTTERFVLTQPIINLKEYTSLNQDILNNSLIIIAVSNKYSTEIINKLEEKSIYNFLILDSDVWDYIQKNTLFTKVKPNKNIAILLYHRVIDSNYNFWKLNVSPSTFEKHMKYLKETYHILKLEDDWTTIVKPDEKYVIITFDDGYVDNYKFALPILEKYKIPATIFVSTDYIDTNYMYWWDELEKIFIIDKYRGSFEFEGKKYNLNDQNDASTTCIDIRNYLKNLSPIERESKFEKLRHLLNVTPIYTEELRSLSSSELKILSQSEFCSIGVHTKSHISMGKNAPTELMQHEIVESKKILESYIQKEITTFAYPYGGIEDRCPLAEKIIIENGFKKIVTVENKNIDKDSSLYNLPRHMIFNDDNIECKINKIWGIYG